MFTAAFNAWNKSNAAFAGTSILQARLFWEPYPQATYQKAASGSNVLGLSGDQGALVVVGVAAAWSNASEDALMNQLAQTVVTNIDTAAKKLGQHYEYKYLNYASPWQDVIQSYGAANMAKLRNMSKKYDPRGIFQKNVPGGFKLV